MVFAFKGLLILNLFERIKVWGYLIDFVKFYKSTRVGHSVFSVQNVPFFSVLKRERHVLFRSFLEIFATYETQKNVTFFSKKRKRMERT